MSSSVRAVKEKALKEVLCNYQTFLRLPSAREDKRLVYLLTMCRLLDKAAKENDSDDSTEKETSTSTTSEPWKLEALQHNAELLFSRYSFDAKLDEMENLNNFVDRLLHPPTDTLLRYI